MLGVSADYLLGEFVHDAKAAGQDAFTDPTTYEINPSFPVQDPKDPKFYELIGLSHKGPQAKGLGKLCPRDGQVCAHSAHSTHTQ